MKGLTILVAVGIIAGALGETTECLKAKTELKACKALAYKNYQGEFLAGDDRKKPDWMARKSCNYLTETVETCVAKIGPCLSEEGLKQEKDEQLASALEQVKKLVTSWDSSKCPVAKAYEERLQAAAEKAAAEESDAAAGKTPEADPTGSSTAMTASVLSTLILAIFI